MKISSTFNLSGYRYLILIAAILMVLLGTRALYLEADPPVNLSGSSDVYTDPAQYTFFAKNFILTGEFNPLDDNRRVFFMKSMVTALSVVVFKLLGTGLWQSNLVGLLLSLGSLFLFFLFVRKIGGNLAGLFFLILIGFNFNQVFYGRLPFLEHAMTFFATLAMVFLVYSRAAWSYVAAGASLAVGILFGKVLGVVYLFPFACLLGYRFYFEQRESALSKRFSGSGLFVGGFVVIAIFWLFFSYFPAQSQVGGYLQEQAVDLYGVPEGLQSFDDFVWKMVSFGVVSNMFPRMSTVAVLGVVFLGIVFFNLGCKKNWRDGFKRINEGHLFIAAMIVAFYGSLMIWNYRPMRYELVLILPFGAAAAIVLSMLWSRWKERTEGRTPLVFYLMFWPPVMVLISQFINGVGLRFGYNFTFDENKWALGALSLMLTVVIGFVINLYRKGKLPRIPVLGKIIVLAALIIVPGRGLIDYYGWMTEPTFTLRDNASDLTKILPPDAVLSGPFAPQFTLSNRMGALIHMFGVAQVDSTLFERFPVTHLLVDVANENRARDDYPRIMGGAVRLFTYHVGKKKVRLIRIAERTNNTQVLQYKRTLFELAVDYYNNKEKAKSFEMLAKFLQLHPNNISGNLMLSELAVNEDQYQQALTLLKKAVEFSPTNYNLNATLAVFFKNMLTKTGDRRYKDSGLVYFDRSIDLAPGIKRIAKARDELKESTIGR